MEYAESTDADSRHLESAGSVEIVGAFVDREVAVPSATADAACLIELVGAGLAVADSIAFENHIETPSQIVRTDLQLVTQVTVVPLN